MGTITKLNVALAMDSSDFERGIAKAEKAGGSLVDSLGKAGKAMTAGVTLPLLAIGGAAVKMSTDFNKGMANIASLGVPIARVKEMKTAIQDMSIETGASTDDMSAGMYKVVSAFGDGADSLKILKINAKAARGGLATLPDTIAMTAAVTKAWGDTSATAVQHVADLGLKTVELGDTTLPELATSLQQVTLMSANLGISQEEMFAAFAASTGVVGSASEVATKLRAAEVALGAPNKDLITAFKAMKVESGAALIKAKGLGGAFVALKAYSDRTGIALSTLVGSAEAANIALYLGGSGADDYGKKLEGLADSAGKTDAAFAAQTEGINAAGFKMEQLQQKIQVMGQRIGDGLAPALGIVLDKVTPLLDKLVELADVFANSSPDVQTWVVGLAGVAAALGPILLFLPGVVSGIKALGGLLAAMSGWAGLAVAAVIALGWAWTTNFGDIQGKTTAAWDAIKPQLMALWDWVQVKIPAAVAWLQTKWNAAWPSMQSALTTAWTNIQSSLATAWTWIQVALPIAVAWLQEKWNAAWPAMQSALTSAWNVIGPALSEAWTWLQTNIPGAVTWLQGVWNTTWPAISETLTTAWNTIGPALSNVWTWLQVNIPIAIAWLQGAWGVAWPAISGALTTAWNTIGPALSEIWTWLQTYIPIAITTLKGIWNTAWPAISGALTTAWNVIGPALSEIWTWLQTYIPIAIATLKGIWNTAWPAISGAVSTAWGIIGPPLMAAWAWLQINLPIAVGTLWAIWNTAWPAISGAVTAAWTKMQEAFDGIKEALGLLPDAATKTQGALGGLWAQLAGMGATLGVFLAPSLGRVQKAFEDLPDKLAPLMPKLQELGAAFGELMETIKPVIVAIGAGLAIAAAFGINLFAAILNNLPGIIGPIIDQVTATIKLISTTITEVIGIVTSIIDGDWAAAWKHAQTLAQAFIDFFREMFSRLGTFATAVFNIISDTVLNTLRDMGVDVTPLLNTIKSAFDTAWNAMKTVIDAIAPAVAGVQVAIENFKGWIAGVIFHNPFQPILDAAEKARDAIAAGVGNITGLTPTGANTVPVSRVEPGQNWGAPNLTKTSPNTIPAFRASGGFAKGWAVVGERGPELIDFGKGGAQVFSNPDTMKMLKSLGIGMFAEGTDWPITPRPAGLYPPIGAVLLPAVKPLTVAATNINKASDALVDSATAIEDSTGAFRSALQGVPGLFGTTQVTADQMKLAKMGVPQEFADNYLRRLTDEVINGIPWDNVDIQDAAARANIDPNLPAEVILEMFRQAWSDSSLFANAANLDLIDQGAVKAAIQKQQDQLAGQFNILQLFGITDEGLQGQISGLGTALANNFQTEMTPELFEPVGAKMANVMASGFGDPGAAAQANSNMIGALQTALTQADMSAKMASAGGKAAEVYWGGWQDFFKKVTLPIPTAPTSSPIVTPGKAGGGPVSSGVGYVVGERGPEYFIPNRNGQIIPNNIAADWMAGATGAQIVNYNTIYNPIDVVSLSREVAEQLRRRR